MKTTLLSATALALILGVPAFAAPHDRGDHRDHATPPATAPAAAPTPFKPGQMGPHNARAPAPNPIVPGATGGGAAHHDNNTPDAGATHRDNNRGGDNNRFNHNGGHNSAFNAFRRAFNAPRHFHNGSYHRPQGYRYQRWAIGALLPSLFWNRQYWIDDYNDFALDNPPPGTVWVRYGDDAVLIDEDSGEVIQVVYGIFY